MEKIKFWNIFYIYRGKIILILFIILSNNLFSQEEKVKRLFDTESKKYIFGFNISGLITDFNIIPSEKGTAGGISNKNGGVNLAQVNTGGGFFAGGYLSTMLFHPYLRLMADAGGGVSTFSMNYKQSNDVFEKSLGRNFREGDNIRKNIMYLYYSSVLLKLSPLRINNYKPFLIGGVSYMYNFGSNESYEGDNRDGIFRMKSGMINYEIGTGVDLYLKYFKLSIIAKGIFGLNNLIIPDNNPTPYTDPIDKMYYKTLSISFIFSASK